MSIGFVEQLLENTDWSLHGLLRAGVDLSLWAHAQVSPMRAETNPHGK